MEDIFEREMKRDTVFMDRNVLSPHYVPAEMPFRDKEIEKIKVTLAPSLKGSNYKNLFVYGKTGTGKTSVTRKVLEDLHKVKEKYGANVESVYVNCKNTNTKYQVFLKITEQFFPKDNFLGFPFQHLMDKMLDTVSKKNIRMIVLLDEIDKVKNLDELIYALTRANDELKSGHIGIIGITNNLFFKDQLDPRSKSTLCDEEMVFSPYNAEQLKEILMQRAKTGFQPNVIDEGALGYAAALSAQESGDARNALLLLMKAGEMADEVNSKIITVDHINKATKLAEDERILNSISGLPEQQKIVLYAIATLLSERGKIHRLDGSYEEEVLFSGEVYERYERLCHELGKEKRSARWCKEYINEIEMMGLIVTTPSSKGTRGNTTLISTGSYSPEKIKRALDTVLVGKE